MRSPPSASLADTRQLDLPGDPSGRDSGPGDLPHRADHADGQFLGYLKDAASAAGGSPSSRSSVTVSQCQSATYDLTVGRLDDLGGFPNGVVPDSGVGVGEGSFGGVEPGGDRGPPLDGDGGAQRW